MRATFCPEKVKGKDDLRDTDIVGGIISKLA
jgi:hypothetical protein